MKMIHCADLHLDSKMRANLNGNKARERKAELLHTFRRMVDYAVQNQVQAILIAGDLFDTKQVSVTARNTVYHAIADHPQIDFYYLKGNHDADSFLNALEDIPENLKLFCETWTSYQTGTKKNITITGAEQNSVNAGTLYNGLVLDTNQINIVMLHGQESDYQSKNQTECINFSALRSKGIDYLALGHIHAYKEGTLDRRGTYCYPGCLEGRGFDECGEHGFVLLDIDEERKTVSGTFVPFAYRRLYTVETDITGCMTTPDIQANISRNLKEMHVGEDSLVKVVLTGSVNVECEKNIDFLVKQFEQDYYFIKIYDESKLAVDYDAFRLDASLKGEFVRCVMEAEDMDDETKKEVIRCGIQALSGEAVDE